MTWGDHVKKGINYWSFRSGSSISDCMSLAKRAGFEGIELALNEDGPVSLLSNAQQMRQIKDMANDIGLELPSLATGLYWRYSLTDNDPKIRSKAQDIVKKQLELAAALDARVILVVPGLVQGQADGKNGAVPYDVAYARAAEALHELKRDAESAKVVIGIENVWNKFLLSPLEMKAFIDDLDSPYVGAYLDVGNVVISGYPEQWISILGRRIKMVHFKDYRSAACGLAGFVDLLAGDVDFASVMSAFEQIGYDDYAFAEMIPPYKQHPEQIIYNTSATMDRILGRRFDA
jgi:L-ribulose-5-phosphate 3-epimerase